MEEEELSESFSSVGVKMRWVWRLRRCAPRARWVRLDPT